MSLILIPPPSRAHEGPPGKLKYLKIRAIFWAISPYMWLIWPELGKTMRDFVRLRHYFGLCFVHMCAASTEFGSSSVQIGVCLPGILSYFGGIWPEIGPF